jgi:hypothetical protein
VREVLEETGLHIRNNQGACERTDWVVFSTRPLLLRWGRPLLLSG